MARSRAFETQARGGRRQIYPAEAKEQKTGLEASHDARGQNIEAELAGDLQPTCRQGSQVAKQVACREGGNKAVDSQFHLPNFTKLEFRTVRFL